MSSSLLHWPEGFARTPAAERVSTSKFSAPLDQTKRQIRRELERMGAQYRIDDVAGAGGDPGVVVRWELDGRQHAVACDHYTDRSANARAIYLWINETRKSGDRPVQTAADQFAAAALPPGREESGDVPAHEVLGVAPNAPEAVVRAAYQTLVKQAHADTGGPGAAETIRALQEAKEVLLDG